MTRRTNGIIAHICGHFQLENLVYFKGFAFPGNSREFPGNRCSREVIPGNLGFGNMLNPSWNVNSSNTQLPGKGPILTTIELPIMFALYLLFP